MGQKKIPCPTCKQIIWEPFFDGETYEPKHDQARLTKQMRAVYELMMDGNWRTLKDISERTGSPEASVSARLRDLRKDRFGNHQVERERVEGGLFKYRVGEK